MLLWNTLHSMLIKKKFNLSMVAHTYHLSTWNQRQEFHWNFEESLVCRANSKPASVWEKCCYNKQTTTATAIKKIEENVCDWQNSWSVLINISELLENKTKPKMKKRAKLISLRSMIYNQAIPNGYSPIISAQRRQRQEGYCKIECSLGHIVRSCVNKTKHIVDF